MLGDVTKTGMGRRVAVDTVPRQRCRDEVLAGGRWSLQCCALGVVRWHAAGTRPNGNLLRWCEEEAKREERNFIERTVLNELRRSELIGAFKSYITALLGI